MAGDGNDDCIECGHAWGPHVLMATMITAEHGGIIFCDQLGCLCETTWSIEDAPLPYIPDDDAKAELRALAQSDDPESPDEDWVDDGVNIVLD